MQFILARYFSCKRFSACKFSELISSPSVCSSRLSNSGADRSSIVHSVRNRRVSTTKVGCSLNCSARAIFTPYISLNSRICSGFAATSAWKRAGIFPTEMSQWVSTTFFFSVKMLRWNVSIVSRNSMILVATALKPRQIISVVLSMLRLSRVSRSEKMTFFMKRSFSLVRLFDELNGLPV